MPRACRVRTRVFYLSPLHHALLYSPWSPGRILPKERKLRPRTRHRRSQLKSKREKNPCSIYGAWRPLSRLLKATRCVEKQAQGIKSHVKAPISSHIRLETCWAWKGENGNDVLNVRSRSMNVTFIDFHSVFLCAGGARGQDPRQSYPTNDRDRVFAGQEI